MAYTYITMKHATLASMYLKLLKAATPLLLLAFSARQIVAFAEFGCRALLRFEAE